VAEISGQQGKFPVSNGNFRSATEFSAQQRNFPLSNGIFRHGECFLVRVSVYCIPQLDANVFARRFIVCERIFTIRNALESSLKELSNALRFAKIRSQTTKRRAKRFSPIYP